MEKNQEMVDRGKNTEEIKKTEKLLAFQIAKIKEELSQEFIQMKKKQDLTFEMEKKLERKLFMKDVKVPTGFTLSAAGWPLVKWPYLGDYTLTSEERNGRPVYSKDRYWSMFCQEDGTWAIEGWVAVGDTKVVYRSKDAAVIPALCQHWEHKEDQEFNSVDITVKFF